LKKTKEKLNKWRNSTFSRMERFNIFKSPILSKLIYTYSEIQMKVQANYAIKKMTKYSKIYMGTKKKFPE
jgi:hypothetical protein